MSAGRSRPVAVRFYRWLLEFAPGELRDRYADEAADVFNEIWVEARQRRGRLGATGVLAHSVLMLLIAAIREWRDGARNANRKRGRMGAIAEDVRYSVRALWKRPGFSLTAALTLAVGIGATTTIFSVVDTVVLRQLPYPNAGRLVYFDEGSHSFPNFRAWKSLSAFEATAAIFGAPVDLVGDGAPERLPAAAVSPDFFPMLGGAPAIGRLFEGDDFRSGSNVVAVSYGAWQGRWGGDPGIVGRTLRINGQPLLVIGVVAETFSPPDIALQSGVDIWTPLGDGGEMANDHRFHVLNVFARLAPATSLEAAQAQIDAQRAADAEAFPEQYRRRDGTIGDVPLVPLREATVRRVRSILFTLLGAVGLLLLIACANVANLFLARGMSRSREIALRSALGASRWRIARQVLMEGTMLALLGGALGVVLAYGGVAAFAHYNPGHMPRIDRLAVDPRILAFTALVSMATGILFGSLPASQAARANASEAMKEGATSVTVNRRGQRVRAGLVVTEIALAVVLMTGAGLLFRTFIRMLQVDPGFDAANLIVLPLQMGAGFEPEQRVVFTQELIDGIRQLPGVASVAAGVTLPFTYTGTSRCCWSMAVRGDPTLFDEQRPERFAIQPITDDYFTTLNAAIAAGREFRDEDGVSGPPVAVVNATAARTLFGTENVIGREIRLDDVVLTIVGVEDDVHHWGLNQPVGNTVYVPYRRYGSDFGMLNIAVRWTSPLQTVAPALRNAVWALRPDLPVGEIQSMEERVSISLAAPRFLALLLGFFAAVSLLLACAGIYSSMLYTVDQRRREMGIRLALGARGGEIIAMVLRSGLLIAIAGVAIGLSAAMALSRVIESSLWNVPPTDPLTYVGVGLMLGATALLACFVPAVKASRADPLKTLRAD